MRSTLSHCRKMLLFGMMVVLFSVYACKPEPEKELTVETWQIGEFRSSGAQAIWGDILVFWEIEEQDWQIVRQYLSMYNLRSREKQRLLEVPASGMADPLSISIYEDKVVWSNMDKSEYERNLSSGGRYRPNSDVFLLDIKTGQIQQITTEEHAQIRPRIYGDTIVWLDTRFEEGLSSPKHYDVYAYDLRAKQEKRLTSTTSVFGAYMDLDICGNLVTWTDNRHADTSLIGHEPDYNSEIYLYDLTTNQEQRITTYPGPDHSADVSGDYIVWQRQTGNMKEDIFLYDLNSGQETQISYSGYASGPMVYGDRIVWTDTRVKKGDYSAANIYLYDLKTQRETQLTPSPEEGGGEWHSWCASVIHGDFVAYVDSKVVGYVTAYVMRLGYK